MVCKKRVVVTGLGAITPIGNDYRSFWDSLIAGKSGAGRISTFDVSQYNSQIAAEVRNFNAEDHFDKKEARRIERFCQFAIVAARQAFEDAGLTSDSVDKDKFGVLVGVGIGGIGLIEEQNQVLVNKGPDRVTPLLIPKIIPNMASAMIAIQLGFKGPNSCSVTACASGANAIGDAFKIIQRGDALGMITGGAESAITPLGLAGFDNMRAITRRNDEPEKASRPFERDRDGFLIGEGSGILFLEELDHARKRGARIHAEIVGYGLSCDAYHLTAPDPKGEGAARAITAAIHDAEIKPQDVNYINAHGTSTPLNDKTETQSIKKAFGEYAYKIPVSSNKSMIGHLLGGAGGAEAVSTILTIGNGIIPPTINYDNPDPECDLDYVPHTARKRPVDIALSNSLGFGGHNAVIAFRKYEDND
ncbi:beta-ketoacyl-ACP synthase II [Candidatus Sumerlaeota bacterium]|nr:beta-ketoacyl-ACP synthase II [Candidatus Sumerlaeota bacterium]